MYRTHTCGELTKEHVGQTVRLSGWVHSLRDQKHHVFLDLRDHYGLTQVACTEDHSAALEEARKLKSESVVTIDGTVVAREQANAGARIGALVVKPKGKSEMFIREWWVTMTLEDFTQLLIDAGYGPRRDTE